MRGATTKPAAWGGTRRRNRTLVAVALPGTPALTDEGWAEIAPLLPINGGRGQRWRDHRRVVAGILWVMRSGAAWRELPGDYGAWQTCHSRYARWRRDGTWGGILTALLTAMPSRGPAP